MIVLQGYEHPQDFEPQAHNPPQEGPSAAAPDSSKVCPQTSYTLPSHYKHPNYTVCGHGVCTTHTLPTDFPNTTYTPPTHFLLYFTHLAHTLPAHYLHPTHILSTAYQHTTYTLHTSCPHTTYTLPTPYPHTSYTLTTTHPHNTFTLPTPPPAPYECRLFSFLCVSRCCLNHRFCCLSAPLHSD